MHSRTPRADPHRVHDQQWFFIGPCRVLHEDFARLFKTVFNYTPKKKEKRRKKDKESQR